MKRKIRLWVPLEEAAELLSMSRWQVYHAIRRGVFPFRWQKIGKQIRVSARDLDVELSENKNAGAASASAEAA
jgi:excisionase family DNA binding protein